MYIIYTVYIYIYIYTYVYTHTHLNIYNSYKCYISAILYKEGQASRTEHSWLHSRPWASTGTQKTFWECSEQRIKPDDHVYAHAPFGIDLHGWDY